MRTWGGITLLVAGLAIAGCSGGSGDPLDATGAAGATGATGEAAATPGCDPRDPAACLLPWPNDRFTVADPTTPTGVRLALPAEGAPANVDGVVMDLAAQNALDGFSPSTAALLFAPGVDLDRSGVATSDDIGASLDPDAPIRLSDLTTGERWPYWAELDAQAPEGRQLLVIHPAIALTEGHRYEVEVVELVDAGGEPVELDLPLAWSFPIASAESLSGQLRAMVADADGLVPDFAVTDTDDSGEPRVVQGTFTVPNYLDNDGSPGGRLVVDDDGIPERNVDNPTWDATFTCIIATSGGPKGTVVYGHGLLGSQAEVLSLAPITALGNLNACATDWVGMASEDVPNVGEILTDLSAFPSLADRLHHAQLAFVLLGRLVNDPSGFATDPAFQADTGGSLLAEDGAVFVGNSQGGILGGAASSVTNEWERVVLGVPGAGYNLLLPRSSNWPRFQEVFNPSYPDALERTLAIELIQLLWDRGENSGYAQHLTADTYPGINPKVVLLIEAFGDHQVANLSTEKLARTIGAEVAPEPLAAGRSTAVDPVWGVKRVSSFPVRTSVLSVWDFGTPAPPPVNLPPLSPEFGRDPHGAASSETAALLQAVTFLTTGEITDTCGGEPCQGRSIDG
jgi:hypothetical protein